MMPGWRSFWQILFHTARLLREHGPVKPVPELIRALAGEVPRGSNADAG
jgi:hypothetical protein